MSWAHPRSLSRRAILWAVLLGLASLTLLAERSFDEWKRDLQKEDVGRRRLATQALREVPDELVTQAVLALSLALRDPDPRLSGEAKETVRRLAPLAGVPIARAAQDPDGPFAEDAMELLGHGGAGVVPAVMEILVRSPDPIVRARGLTLLERQGPAAAAAAPELERMALESQGADLLAFLRVLWLIDPRGETVFRVAQHATRDPDPDLRAKAWLGLAHSPWILVRARDPRYARELAETLERELPFIPPPLQRALEEGLEAAKR